MKTTLLLGAGAVLDWGGPKTLCSREHYEIIPEHGSDKIRNRPCCLTHLLTVIGFKDKNGERITNKIYNKLKLKNPNVNFETIISIIEELYNCSFSKNTTEYSSLYSLLEVNDVLEEYSYFTTSEVDNTSGTYSIEIPYYESSDTQRIPIRINPYEKYFELFVADILSFAFGQISKYSYLNPDGAIINEDVNNDMNKAFTEWINNITGFNAALRIYTLNYDRLFKSLLAKEGMNLFEGFVNEDDLVRSGQRRGPDIRRILSDSSCNVHYNLHGSASWSVENQNDNGLPGYTYLLQTLGMVYRNYATIEIERGKKLLLTPLITGFQKVQRTAISPFRQMFSAFDSDCLGTDVLYIIGYSFGDEHINDIIRNAKKYNLKMKVVIVDPNFDEQYFFLNFLSSWIDIGKAVFGPNRSHKDPYEPYNVYPIRKTFKDYLTDSTSSSLLA